MRGRIIYPEVVSGRARRPPPPRRLGPLGFVGRAIGGALLLAGAAASAVLMGAVLFMIMASLFAVGCLLGLLFVWRMRRRGGRGGDPFSGYVIRKGVIAEDGEIYVQYGTLGKGPVGGSARGSDDEP